MVACDHFGDTFPVGLLGVLVIIILVRSLKAASSSAGSRIRSALVLGFFPRCENNHNMYNKLLVCPKRKADLEPLGMTNQLKLLLILS